MANETHLNILKEGVAVWNAWRQSHQEIIPDLRDASFEDLGFPTLNEIDLSRSDLRGLFAQFLYISGANLTKANLEDAKLWGSNFSYSKLNGANLTRACLREAFLRHSDFSDATLISADLSDAFLTNAIFSRAKLRNADLYSADLGNANLQSADLSGARLSKANLTSCCLEGAVLNDCEVYGTSAWDIVGKPANQNNLRINSNEKPQVMVDDIEAANLVYLLHENQSWSRIVNTMTSRAVLILGRFEPERRKVLEAIADELRKFNELPILFTFDKPADRSVSETVRIFAGLSKYIIVDLTSPKSSPLECHLTVPDIAVPLFPIIQEGEDEFSMFDDLYDYDWVLEGFKYKDIASVRANIPNIREEALRKREVIAERRKQRKKGFRTSLSGKSTGDA